MIRRVIARRRHRKALWLFQDCYESLNWLRATDAEMVRENVAGRHASYNAIIDLMWGENRSHETPVGIFGGKA